MIFTKNQEYIINEGVNFYKNSSEQVFQVAGLAGTGKSTILAEIIRRININPERIATMTYTGTAAIVLRMKGIYNAGTIHSWLYRPIDEILYDENGNEIMNDYFNRPKFGLTFIPKPLIGIDLIMIDEGWMVPYNMKEEIESRGIKIIVSGDPGQLPPVADKPAYLYKDKIHYLTEIMRQEMNSGKVYIADRVRNGLQVHKGFYGDVYVIDEDELTNNMILFSDVVLSAKNSTRDIVNNKIRELLGFNTDIPSYGERVICRRNNWKKEIDGISMANGLRGRVINYPSIHSFDGKTFNIDFQPDYMNKAFLNTPCDYEFFKAPFGQKDNLKNSKYNFDEKFEFGYGLTVHLSQGSQYPNVLYFEEFLSRDIQNSLNYTAATRAMNNLIFVKQKRKFY